jgi:hypothetical protein
VRTAATPETRTIQELRATMTAAMNIPDEQVNNMMTGTVLNASAGSALD